VVLTVLLSIIRLYQSSKSSYLSAECSKKNKRTKHTYLIKNNSSLHQKMRVESQPIRAEVFAAASETHFGHCSMTIGLKAVLF